MVRICTAKENWRRRAVCEEGGLRERAIDGGREQGVAPGAELLKNTLG